MFVKSPGDVIPEWEKKLMWSKWCLLFPLPIGSCWSRITSQKVRNSTKMTSAQIYFQSWNEKKRDISGGSKLELLRTHGSLESHAGHKIQENFDWKGFGGCSHPPYSPDLSQRDF
jgi:hypothetical protein